MGKISVPRWVINFMNMTNKDVILHGFCARKMHIAKLFTCREKGEKVHNSLNIQFYLIEILGLQIWLF